MKYYLLHIIILVSFLVNASISVQAQVTFQKTYGNTFNSFGKCVRQTSDGGFLIAALHGGSVYILKTDTNGAVIYWKRIGGADVDRGYALEITSDGGFIVVGETRSFGAPYEAYLIKLDALGNVIWSKTYGGATSGEAGYSISQCNDGGYIVLGRARGNGPGNAIYLFKTDSMGNHLWSKVFNGTDPTPNVGRCVRQTDDGGYILAGSTYDPEFPLTQISDAWMIKTDSNGNVEWGKQLAGTWGIVDDFGYCVQQTLDGGYILAGETWSPDMGSSSDAFLIKTDSQGDTLWTKAYGHDNGSQRSGGRWVEQTSDGGYIITGYLWDAVPNSGVYLIKTDSQGDTLWTKVYGGLEGNSVQQTPDGGYIVVGTTQSFGPGFSNIYLIKTDSLGNSGEGCNESHIPILVRSFSFSEYLPVIVDSFATVDSNVTSSVGNESIIESYECDTTVSISPSVEDGEQINIYPNPTTGKVTLTNLPQEPTRITVYNVLGEQIQEQELNTTDEHVIDLSAFPDGLYLIQLESGQVILSGRVIKQ